MIMLLPAVLKVLHAQGVLMVLCIHVKVSAKNHCTST